MFWLYLLLRPSCRYVTVRYVHVYWRHPRFHHALYWLTGLAFLELAAWFMLAELAVYTIAAWWLLWLLARAVTAVTGHWRTVPARWVSALASMRPAWPKIAATGVRP
jgi:hypothetical protein